MPQSKHDPVVGLLHPALSAKNFNLARYYPSAELSFFIEHYWIVRWDLRGCPPFLSELLPNASVDLVIERGQSGVFGLVTGKFCHLLEGKGQVAAVKFRPGAFYPFFCQPVSAITDRALSLYDMFGMAGIALESEILSLDDDVAIIDRLESFLRIHLPREDAQVVLANEIIDCIHATRAILRVDNLVGEFGLSKRSLQRLFQTYVGVSPKQVIQRRRLQEATEHLASGKIIDWPRLAVELGYFDQAHFIRDFKTIVGMTPAAYAQTALLNS